LFGDEAQKIPMNPTTKSTAEARLDAALAAAGLEDPRPALRAQLKRLRMQDEAAFQQAVRLYDEDVVPALAADARALDTWLAYAQRLGEMLAAGRFLAVDPGGRAALYTAPYQPGDLVLHVPDDAAAPTIPAALPAQCSPHQQATLDLLVHSQLGS
jgi:hypothetical protein